MPVIVAGDSLAAAVVPAGDIEVGIRTDARVDDRDIDVDRSLPVARLRGVEIRIDAVDARLEALALGTYHVIGEDSLHGGVAHQVPHGLGGE